MCVLLMSLIVTMVVYMLFIAMFYKVENSSETISAYECGFDPNSVTRMSFSYRFYLISILFIIFDVEIALMLPIPFMNEMEVGMIIFMIFIMILLFGLLYEYYCGSLSWMSDMIKS